MLRPRPHRRAHDRVPAAAADWVWPYWLHRQLDPGSPAFVPGDGRPRVANVTARNWTTVGNVDSPEEAVVDPRGLVTPWPGGWSLDWWVAASDRWHLPSQEAAVRQRLVDDAPVVETAMRVPRGDVVQRVYAARAAAGTGAPAAGDVVVVEVENASPVPVGVAFAVRPYHPTGLAFVERIGLDDGTTVTVEGRVALLLPRLPNGMAGSTLVDGDVATTVREGRAGASFPDRLRCPEGMASAAFVYPLAHTATIRVVLPLGAPARARRQRGARGAVPIRPAAPSALPSADQVARGWRVQGDRGLRLVLPDDRLASCVEANRRFLLLRYDGGDAARLAPSVPPRSPSGDAALLGALDRYGYASDAAEVLRSYPARQRSDGSFPGTHPEGDATAAVLVALAEHWRLHRDVDLVREVAPAVAGGAERIARRRAGRGRWSPGPGDEDDLWAVRALLDAAALLAAAGEDEGASAAHAMTDAVRRDAGSPASLAGCWPLRLLPADDPGTVAAAEAMRDRLLVGDAVVDGVGHTGLSPSLTLQLASVELLAGDRRALDRLAWVLDAATPTWTWPGAVHPRLAGGCAGDGHDAVVAAHVLSFVRDLLVHEVPAAGAGAGGAATAGLVLCPLVPEGWLGRGLEVHGAPTHHGRLSYALRWHGDRPALLWELEGRAGDGPVRLTAPGLDPTWWSTEPVGEVLLAPVPPTPVAPTALAPTGPPPAGTPVRIRRS